MDIYVTKYALTKGIEKVSARIDGELAAEDVKSWRRYFHGEGREWHRTMKAAVAKAEQMRDAKIKSLRKAISKLEQRTFP